MNKIEYVYCLFTGALCGVLLGLLGVISEQKQTITELQAQLTNSHHCISVCVEQFEKMGC